MSGYSYFFDTTVIVHYFQKNQASKINVDRLLSGEAKAAISTITELELWVGIKEDEVERHVRSYKYNVSKDYDIIKLGENYEYKNYL